ncbi:hypothetical protein C4553_01615, partial [Candidatus Parcubacteria bacterium]
QHKALADKNVRLALRYATDKRSIIRETLGNNATLVNSFLFNSERNDHAPEFNTEMALQVLEASNWIDSDGDGIRERKINTDEGSTTLEFSMVVPDIEEFTAVAEAIKNQWAFIGIRVTVEPVQIGQIQNNYIQPRNYQILLFGEVLGIIPDLYVFWHSTQKRDPGINLALYDNKDVDTLIEEARKAKDSNQHRQLLNLIEETITNDVPALFLYNPYYIYLVDKDVGGVKLNLIPSPAERFSGINQWFTKTKRIRK